MKSTVRSLFWAAWWPEDCWQAPHRCLRVTIGIGRENTIDGTTVLICAAIITIWRRRNGN